MAHVRSAMLCDFAQVREGLLFVSSGGITRVAAPALGAPVSISVAGELEAFDGAFEHEERAVVRRAVAVRVVGGARRR